MKYCVEVGEVCKCCVLKVHALSQKCPPLPSSVPQVLPAMNAKHTPAVLLRSEGNSREIKLTR